MPNVEIATIAWHAGKVLVRHTGIFYEISFVDFLYRGSASVRQQRADVVEVVKLLYDAVGGRPHYASQPTIIKELCKGLRRDLIRRAFPTATYLLQHLEMFDWDVPRADQSARGAINRESSSPSTYSLIKQVTGTL